jgi:hypothetical protein
MDVEKQTSLPESRLESLYRGEGFGGDNSIRARVIRELIDEIRELRRELARRTPLDRPQADH